MEFHGQYQIKENFQNGVCVEGGVYLPEEILFNIFVYLESSEILNCALVCKKWCNMAKSNILWQTIYNIKEYPKKAKNLPWYVFYSYLSTNNFKNLLKNGNGQEQHKHWYIVDILKHGYRCLIEDQPDQCDPLPEGISEFNGYTSCFRFTNHRVSMYQEIKVLPRRLLQYIVKKYKPTLYLSEWYCSRYRDGLWSLDHNRDVFLYTLAVRCDTENKKWIPESQLIHGIWGEQTTPYFLKYQTIEVSAVANDGKWKKMEITTQNYPADMDTIYFCHEGKALEGYHGSKMAGGVIKFLFESIETCADDIGDVTTSSGISRIDILNSEKNSLNALAMQHTPTARGTKQQKRKRSRN